MMVKNILVISYYYPTRKHAGGLRILDLYYQVKMLSKDVNIVLFSVDRKESSVDKSDAIDLFSKVILVPENEFIFNTLKRHVLKEEMFDLVDCQYFQSGAFLSLLKKELVGTTAIFSPMEVLLKSFINSFKVKLFSGATGLYWLFATTKGLILEIIYMRSADILSFVSPEDQKVISVFFKSKTSFAIPTCISDIEFIGRNEHQYQAKGSAIVYIAYFKSETNRQSLIWFVNNVYLNIKSTLPEVTLRVVGRGIDEALRSKCKEEGVKFIGEVDNLPVELMRARIGIAPAITGAGIRGKIHQYSSLGIPCVASRLAVQGLLYEDGISIYTADSSNEFALQCIKLLKDKKLSISLGASAKQICIENYTWAKKSQEIKELYHLN